MTDPAARPPTTTRDRVLVEAEFNRKVRSYWLLSGAILCVVTVVGIAVLPFWLLLGHLLTERYLKRMTCTLTERSLKVTRGIMVRREMTVPLDKITDVGLVEGPIMRLMDLQAVKIETAGQATAGAAVQLVGIMNARQFRDQVLAQRDEVSSHPAAHRSMGAGDSEGAGPVAIGGSTADTGALLTEIRDALIRIEERLPSP